MQGSVQSISVFLYGLSSTSANIIKGVSKHSWGESTKLRYYIKSFLKCSGNFSVGLKFQFVNMPAGQSIAKSYLPFPCGVRVVLS